MGLPPDLQTTPTLAVRLGLSLVPLEITGRVGGLVGREDHPPQKSQGQPFASQP